MSKLLSEFNPFLRRLKKRGICLINDYYSRGECESMEREIKSWLKKVYKDLDDSWREECLPSCSQYGEFDNIIGYSPPIWKIREDSYRYFKRVYNDSNLLTSIEGAILCPPRSYDTLGTPLLNQTNSNTYSYKFFVNVGTDVTFYCYPDSYCKTKDTLLKIGKIEDDNNPLKLSQSSFDKLEYEVQEIFVPRGGLFIVRSDILISSPVPSSHPSYIKGWTCIVPVTMRKRSDFSPKGIRLLRESYLSGVSTDMWGKPLPLITDWRVKRCKPDFTLLKYKGNKTVLKLVGVRDY